MLAVGRKGARAPLAQVLLLPALVSRETQPGKDEDRLIARTGPSRGTSLFRLGCGLVVLALKIAIPMLREADIKALLAPFELELTATQAGQLLTYLNLLLKWNLKMNLTSVRDARECVSRHFGESLYLARWTELRGTLLDIGSGAGFPGLALKIAFPHLQTTLLEPVTKKRAFLKEVAEACRMESVDVRSERLEDYVREGQLPLFSTATARAVGHLEHLVNLAAQCLEPGGRLCLWLSRGQRLALGAVRAGLVWNPPITLPLSQQREIWVGTRRLGEACS